MQILNAKTEDFALTELTYLSADADANSISVTVENPQGWAADDYLIIERRGSEIGEINKIASVIGKIITLSSNISFDHKIGTQIQKILFNQRKFYRSDSKTGMFSILPGGTKDIEVDRPEGTLFEDTAGTSLHWYKATYYNLIANIETSLDDAIPCQASESDHYTSLFEIRKQAGFEEAFGIRDENINGYREEAENEFESRIASLYPLPLSPKPKLVRQIINLLAAGNLLIKEYGMEADIEISKSGARMLERANELIDKIVDGSIKLLDDEGNLLASGREAFLASGSNVFSEAEDKGELFNIEMEQFRFKDPEHPRS